MDSSAHCVASFMAYFSALHLDVYFFCLGAIFSVFLLVSAVTFLSLGSTYPGLASIFPSSAVTFSKPRTSFSQYGGDFSYTLTLHFLPSKPLTQTILLHYTFKFSPPILKSGGISERTNALVREFSSLKC